MSVMKLISFTFLNNSSRILCEAIFLEKRLAATKLLLQAMMHRLLDPFCIAATADLVIFSIKLTCNVNFSSLASFFAEELQIKNQ